MKLQNTNVKKRVTMMRITTSHEGRVPAIKTNTVYNNIVDKIILKNVRKVCKNFKFEAS